MILAQDREYFVGQPELAVHQLHRGHLGSPCILLVGYLDFKNFYSTMDWSASYMRGSVP